MASVMPKKLQGFNIRVAGGSWIGFAESIDLPKLTRKSEEWRGGGMETGVKVDMGGEPLEMTITLGGFSDAALDLYGEYSVSATPIFFYGSYEAEGEVTAVEVEVRGRFSEIDMGSAKSGDNTQHKVKADLSYYKITVAGKEKIEIDAPNFVYKVNGKDMIADRKAALMLNS